MADIKKDGKHKESKTSDVDSNISSRYEIKKRLGKGAYGIVWKAIDNTTKDVVAVKKIFEAFRNQTDAQRTYREIMFLQGFRTHPNIITLRGIHRASNNKDIYLAFDFMDSDLHHVIKRGTVLKDVHKRYIMYQLLRATLYLHSGNVIHRDLKPSNVLINTECKIKIADFGLARSLTHSSEEDDQGILTDYVATRWYRAPEILVASKKYTKGVDMWSVGCILGEMLTNKPLFPGSSTVNQMERILAVLPQPTQQEICNMCSGYGKGLLENYSGPKTTLQEVAAGVGDEPVDLLIRLLVFDPARRLTAEYALKHPYVSRYRQGREMILDSDVVPPLDDDVQLSVADYRNKLYEMIESARTKRRPSKADMIQHSPEGAKPSSGGADRKVKQYKSPVTKSNYSDIWQRAIEKTHQRTNQPEAKATNGDLKPLEGGFRRHKQNINEDIKKMYSQADHHSRNNALDYSYKTGQNQRFGEKKNLPNWSEKTRAPAKPIRARIIENGGGDCIKGHIMDPIAQAREKLQRLQAMNTSSLPRVPHKKENVSNSSSPPYATRYARQQGLLSQSAIQDIRNAFKH